MKISATYLIAAQLVALGLGYVLRAPDLQATAERQTTIPEGVTSKLKA